VAAGLAGGILSLVAEGHGRGLCWLDGGDGGRGWLGTDPDVEVEGDDLALLDGVEDLWRDRPEYIWIGWLTYDLGADWLLGRRVRALPLPGLVMRRYPAALALRGSSTVPHGDRRACDQLVARLRAAPQEPAVWPLESLEALSPPHEYCDRVRRALAHIVAGDTYQVNLSQAFSARWRDGADASLCRRAAWTYASVREATPASMGALLHASPSWILSNSPETLLEVRLSAAAGEPDVACSWPLKGTRPRGATHDDDQRARDELRTSAKDAAEHVMIVDLVRNDLGRVAKPGSVRAPAQPDLLTLPTVHHLVSRIECDLRPGWSLRGLLEAVYPGGSITGAPKRRTVEIIDEIEAEPRGIYCGAIVVLEPGGLRCSIPIRTATLDEHGLSLRSGGGIVADSDPEHERHETIVKTRAFDRG
jgi:anthranilate/para-aminobenzoate synthase component I